MIFDKLKAGLSISDEAFDRLYSPELRIEAEFAFTPIDVVKAAVNFLVTKPGTRILDVGSGGGKFCLVGASISEGYFTGVEIDEAPYLAARELQRTYQINKVEFIHANVTSISFNAYDGIYLFNPFTELLSSQTADESIRAHKKALYHFYTSYVFEQLKSMLIGSRLVTYFAPHELVPPTHKMVEASFDGKLKFWIKET